MVEKPTNLFINRLNNEEKKNTRKFGALRGWGKKEGLWEGWKGV
jgi:hypothetical protein